MATDFDRARRVEYRWRLAGRAARAEPVVGVVTAD
jgi:hypothetical protein